jgi:toxin HigB-1
VALLWQSGRSSAPIQRLCSSCDESLGSRASRVTGLRKLIQLDLAERIDDMRVPPGNRLESLVGDRAGQWCVRINDRFRLCFLWVDENAEEVEIVDYH